MYFTSLNGHNEFACVAARSTLRQSGLRRWTIRIDENDGSNNGFGLIRPSTAELAAEHGHEWSWVRGGRSGHRAAVWVTDLKRSDALLISDWRKGLVPVGP